MGFTARGKYFISSALFRAGSTGEQGWDLKGGAELI